MPLGKDHPDYVTALDRGLAVIQAFDADHPSMTLAEISGRVGLSRGTTRRFLLTLIELGFVSSDGRNFALTPKIMRLGYAYLSSLGIGEVAQPIVKALSARIEESCSLALLDDLDVVFVARAEARRVFRTGVTLGARLPAHATSLGRVLLAALADADLDAWLERLEPVAFTPKTITDKGVLRRAILKARADGFATVDDELQLGVRSVAVPVFDKAGHVEAALNVGALTPRTSFATMVTTFVPLLRGAAAEISGTPAAR